MWPRTHYPLKWTTKLLLKNCRICKHEANYKNLSPPLFYVDVINVWSLCYGKCITQMKDGPSVIKFLTSIYSQLYYSILETADFLSSDSSRAVGSLPKYIIKKPARRIQRNLKTLFVTVARDQINQVNVILF